MNGFLLSELFNLSFDISGATQKASRHIRFMQLSIVQSHGTRASKTCYSVTNRPLHLLSEKPDNQITLFPLYQNGEDQTSTQTLNLNTVTIDQFSKVLKLGFSLPQSPGASPVCFSEASEVRDEFKVSFSAVDLFNYALASIWNQDTSDPIIPLPHDEQQFWELVKAGGEIRRKPGLN